MGYRTPNIDRIASEGACSPTGTASRAAPPAAPPSSPASRRSAPASPRSGCRAPTLGLQPEDPTIADLLKPLGYATGQFGKNHLGDRDEFLPTAHGFDEFFGNLYHLNAEEEPENPRLPQGSGVPQEVRSARRAPLPGPNPRRRQQKIENTGPLTTSAWRRSTRSSSTAALEFIDRGAQGRQAVLRLVELDAHAHLHASEEGVAGQDRLGIYPDGMVEHDGHVGQLLDKLDELGIADNTIVMYSTDNGAEDDHLARRRHDAVPRREGHNWEGGLRVPCLIRWPGVIKPGTVVNEIFSHEDMLPTLVAAAGEPDVEREALKGYKVGGKTFKVHIDGYNLLPFLKGEVEAEPAQGVLLLERRRRLVALRLRQLEARFHGAARRGSSRSGQSRSCRCGTEALQPARDPFERADQDSNKYSDWLLDRVFLLVPAQAYVARVVESLKEFPPRQTPASFSLET